MDFSTLKSVFLILIVLLIGVVSCKKATYKSYPPGLLKKVIVNGTINDGYEYNDDFRLKTHRNYFGGGLRSTVEYRYDQDTIRKSNSNSSYSDYISYILGPDTMIRHEDGLVEFYNYSLSISSGDDCGPTLRGNYVKGFEDHYDEYIIEYFDENCSEWIFEYDDGEYRGKWMNKRDDKHSWDTSVYPEYLRDSDYGNIIETHSYDSADNLLSSTYYEYEYNSYGFPTSVTSYLDSIVIGGGSIKYFEYY